MFRSPLRINRPPFLERGWHPRQTACLLAAVASRDLGRRSRRRGNERGKRTADREPGRERALVPLRCAHARGQRDGCHGTPGSAPVETPRSAHRGLFGAARKWPVRSCRSWGGGKGRVEREGVPFIILLIRVGREVGPRTGPRFIPLHNQVSSFPFPTDLKGPFWRDAAGVGIAAGLGRRSSHEQRSSCLCV